MTRVLVIGGGVSGLAAAWEVTHPGDGGAADTVVLAEAGDRLGGVIATESFAGIDLDTGPDAFLARVPAAAQLAREAGLGAELVAPGTGQAWLWTRGRLRRLPTGLALGVPVDLAALARSRVLPPAATVRAALDLVLPGRPVGPDEDVAVGELVRRRLGTAVQLGLVDPLVGGINAGHTDTLSAAVAAPQLLAAARRDRSLIRALRSSGTTGTASGAITLAGQGGGPAPVFLTVRGGLSRLVDALAAGVAACPGSEIVLGRRVESLVRAGAGPAWEARLADGETIVADGVIIACPAAEAARLLTALSPAAATELAAVGTSSVALSLLAYPEAALPAPLAGSGLLVPRAEGRLLTAASWVWSKWPHLSTPGMLVIRASAGRVDDERAMAMDDDRLIAALHDELAAAMGLRARPVEARVGRFPHAFPQFAVGHLGRISRAESRLAQDAPGVALAGAALRGVGIATCITRGRAAAERVRRSVGTTRS
jgi:oxygen-dependent protoporphyrinogen oxidase